MPLHNSKDTYGSIARTFHWLMAIIIPTMLCLGVYMAGLPLSPQKLNLYGWHKSFGTLVLILVTLRLLWRLHNITPQLPQHMIQIQKIAAHTSHILLYCCMFLMPLSGWLMSSSAGFSVSFFQIFQLPDLVEPNKIWHLRFKLTHTVTAITLFTLIIIHLSAALLHHFYYKDTILTRMLPLVKRK